MNRVRNIYVYLEKVLQKTHQNGNVSSCVQHPAPKTSVVQGEWQKFNVLMDRTLCDCGCSRCVWAAPWPSLNCKIFFKNSIFCLTCTDFLSVACIKDPDRYKFFFIFTFFVFLGPHQWHMEVSRLGVELELQLPAYTTATATQDPSHICKLYHSSHQCWTLNPLDKAREWMYLHPRGY